MPTVQNGRGLRPSRLSMINLRFIPEISTQENSHPFKHQSLSLFMKDLVIPGLKAACQQQLEVCARTAALHIVWVPNLERSAYWIDWVDPRIWCWKRVVFFQGTHCSWQQRYVPWILCASGPSLRRLIGLYAHQVQCAMANALRIAIKKLKIIHGETTKCSISVHFCVCFFNHWISAKPSTTQRGPSSNRWEANLLLYNLLVSTSFFAQMWFERLFCLHIQGSLVDGQCNWMWITQFMK